MSILAVTFYVAKCDRCGYEASHGDYSAWGRSDDATDAVDDDGWDTEGGNHVCDECIPHPPDWDEEHALARDEGVPLICQWCNVNPIEGTDS